MQINYEWYWMCMDVCEVQRQWRYEFVTKPPTKPTASIIHDKSD
jgi:hypothetical protein